MTPETITYLRAGRSVRSQGQVISRPSPGFIKVKPSRKDWGCVLLTDAEINAGTVKGPVKPREKKEDAPPERKPRAKKVPQSRLDRILTEIESTTASMSPGAVVMVEAMFLAEIAEELRELRGLFQLKEKQ